MKNVLFASTAMIVGFAGIAAADVTISGNAEMGIFGVDSDVEADDQDVQFHNDVDVTFTMSGETDGGLAFGASVDLDEAGNLGDEEDNIGVAIFLSGAFGTVTLGDTDGALDWALTEVNFNSGSIRDDETEHAGFNGNGGLDGFGLGDNQVLRYDYTVGDFAFAVSAEQLQENDTLSGDVNNQISGETLGIGFRYAVDLGGSQINLGLGYQDHSGELSDGTDVDADAIGVSANATFGAITAGVSYLDLEVDDADLGYEHFGVGIGYTEGAISASLNYGEYDNDDGTEDEGFGLSAGYDLGGGASIQFGYGDGDEDGVDVETFSLGVRMNF
ncbi:porin [Jannaschia sp. Os4]|uniref:porin n=1 Tax=Jannaschia sp. Os4 TaxID=2807617 RepID=UPI001939B355|nr:porin [Jannaschia sp. Os4]MBM2575045.1 porin [Jannaschia sp. Os4]